MKKACMGKRIKKRHIEAAVLFAIDHIPQVDPNTLKKFLELIDINGNFGSVSDQQLVHTMSLLVKHIPSACGYSLLTLAELLDVCVSTQETYKFNVISEDFQPTWLSP